MKNKQCNLKQRLEKHFEDKISMQHLSREFSKLMLYLDKVYKLSDVYNYDVELNIDKENNNNHYKFIYDVEDDRTDIDTTIYIFFILKSQEDINSKSLGIVFDEISLGEGDYPYGKTTTYLLNGNIETQYFNYNNDDINNKNDYIKKLIKK